MFVLVHQLREMGQSGLRERWKRHGCLPQVSSVHVSFPKAPFPGTGFPLLPPENSVFLIHKEAGAALELTFKKCLPRKYNGLSNVESVLERPSRWARLPHPASAGVALFLSALFVGGILFSISVGD